MRLHSHATQSIFSFKQTSAPSKGGDCGASRDLSSLGAYTEIREFQEVASRLRKPFDRNPTFIGCFGAFFLDPLGVIEQRTDVAALEK